MIASTQPDPVCPAFARALLAAAAQVEADERAIKDAILAAARAGDCARVIDLLTRWQTMPVSEVLGPALDSRGMAAVTVPERGGGSQP